MMRKAMVVPCPVGLGHTKRCIRLLEQLEGSMKSSLRTMLVLPPECRSLLGAICSQAEIRLISSHTSSADLATFLASQRLRRKQVCRILTSFHPDIVIEDGVELFALPLSRIVCGARTILVTQTAMIRYIQPDYTPDLVDLIILPESPDLAHEDDMRSLRSLHTPFVYVGPFLGCAGKLARGNRAGATTLKGGSSTFLVTVGGARARIALEVIRASLKAYLRLKKSPFDSVSVAAGAFSHIVDSIPGARISGTLPDLSNLMARSDVVVTLAGHNTLMELIHLNARAVVIPIPGHFEQMRNAAMVAGRRNFRVIPPDELNGDTVYGAITSLLEETIDIHTMKPPSLFDGEAEKRAAALVRGLLECGSGEIV